DTKLTKKIGKGCQEKKIFFEIFFGVSMPAAFQWLKPFQVSMASPFLCFAFNFVEGFAVLAALFEWLKPFICFAFLGFSLRCFCG
ncbi:MAG: hypothetical protein II060_05610, partial [Bacteroidales bacterium]|nr:hypothetical protein [Bacteroidales bacterium]